ncbi:PepSY domain-containing protein [Niallia sp. NCCP-28]|uniref:PepSY domain-containing protein n=1 Tax=Niallia sp. NCCP-28 TaxID=2934712 RepID=UPI00208D4D19|nr:PepSY domain-containing protein [Niallia sp. NCCP-28]GKU81320.1 lipoprotein [Niallia sp. NCCP-28]
MKKIWMNFSIITALALGLAACSQNDTNQESANNATTNNESESLAKANLKVNIEDAVKTFQDKYPDAAITEMSLDNDFGKWHYEVEGVDEQNQYEVEIDGDNGDLNVKEEEKLDADDANGVKKEKEALNLDNLITQEKLLAIVNDAQKGAITQWSLEKASTATYFDVSVEEQMKEYEVSVDAQTGKILEQKQDD